MLSDSASSNFSQLVEIIDSTLSLSLILKLHHKMLFKYCVMLVIILTRSENMVRPV